ncbi:hypothetical protein E2562_006932 [Oryza meyeriana var. granulata]|uniref:Uncharacterized protein n=1 Tax=Oryza meyeriana var. granulata TaxID=110450 RepID=A0A6G1E9C3_9ORYZ|nr:hypothetical protein E2562_006932 [Oryza meyeriana var. granulata]
MEELSGRRTTWWRGLAARCQGSSGIEPMEVADGRAQMGEDRQHGMGELKVRRRCGVDLFFRWDMDEGGAGKQCGMSL